MSCFLERITKKVPDSEKMGYPHGKAKINVYNACSALKSMGLFAQNGHLNRGNGSLGALVAMFSTTAVFGLLQGIIGKDAENNGGIEFYIKIFDALGNRIADKIEMFGFTLYYATNGDHGINPMVGQHLFATEYQLEASGNVPPNDMVGLCAAFDKGAIGTIEKCFGDFLVPFRDHDPKLQAFQIGNFGNVVFGKIFMRRSHYFPLLAIPINASMVRASSAVAKSSLILWKY